MLRIQGRLDIAGADGVDVDAVAAPLPCHGLGQIDGAGLGGAVGGELIVALGAADGAHIDDLSAFALVDHLLCRGLGAEIHALEVGVDDAVILGLCHVGQALCDGHAGIVDHDIQPAIGLHGLLDQGVDLLDILYVCADTHRFSAQFLHLRGHCVAVILVAARDDDLCARAGQLHDDAIAESLGSTGHDRDLSAQIKRRYHEFFFTHSK